MDSALQIFLTRADKRGRITAFHLLEMFFLMQPSC